MMIGTLVDRNTAFEDLPEVLTPKEVSDYLGVHVKSVRRAITDGKLRAFRNGSRYYVCKDWVREFQDAQIVAVVEPRRLITESDLRAIGVLDGHR